MAVGRAGLAVGLLVAVACADPEADARGLVEAAEAHLDAGRPDDALSALRSAAAHAPGEPGLWFRIGEGLTRLGATPEAKAAYERASAAGHSAAHVRLAQMAVRREDYGRAAEHARHAVASDPANAEAHHLTGQLLTREGRLVAAIESFVEATRVDSGLGEAWFHLGEVRTQAGDDAGAEAAFRRAVRVDESNARYQDGLGQAMARRGQLEAAILHFRRAITADSLYARAHFGLGNAYRRTGQRELARRQLEIHRRLTDEDQRIVALLDAIARQPDDAAACHDLARLYQRRDQQSLAAQYYRRAIRVDASFAPAYVNLGNMHLRVGRTEAAMDLFAGALRADSTYALAHAAMGNAHMLGGRHRQGVESFERAAALAPGDESLRRSLAAARQVAAGAEPPR